MLYLAIALFPRPRISTVFPGRISSKIIEKSIRILLIFFIMPSLNSASVFQLVVAAEVRSGLMAGVVVVLERGFHWFPHKLFGFVFLKYLVYLAVRKYSKHIF